MIDRFTDLGIFCPESVDRYRKMLSIDVDSPNLDGIQFGSQFVIGERLMEEALTDPHPLGRTLIFKRQIPRQEDSAVKDDRSFFVDLSDREARRKLLLSYRRLYRMKYLADTSQVTIDFVREALSFMDQLSNTMEVPK